MTVKIVLLDGLALNQDLDWTALKKLGHCTRYDRTSVTDDAEILRRIGDAPVVLTHKTPLSADVIQHSAQLKYIGIMGTGYDMVAVAAAQAAGITVTNIPTYGTEAVAQFTIALLLEITSQVGLHNDLVHAGRWAQGPDFTFWAKPLIELHGKVMGLVGYGHIAQRVAALAHAFGMPVIFDNHRPKDHLPNWIQQVSFSELLHRADVISLHVLQKPETIGLINAAAIQQMKDGVILLNTARGKLINEADVAAALNRGKIGAAGLDVVSREPIRADNPLLAAKNCFLTPHIAWAPQETRQRLLDITVSNLTAFLAGRRQNVVAG